MERAQRLGLVSTQRPPRVSISINERLYASVELNTESFERVPCGSGSERFDGSVVDEVVWRPDIEATDILVEVGRTLFRHTCETFDTGAFLGGLADLLEAALSSPEHRPALQLCPPQWVVCDWGVTALGRCGYGVRLDTLHTSPTIESHVSSEPWVDRDSWKEAAMAARALFPAG